MANKQKKSENIEAFNFFKQTVEVEGVQAMTAAQVIDPSANESGSYTLDYDLVVPFPEGRITEIFGEESTCKTTLSLEVAGRAIRKGKTVLYINMEKNLNLSLMRTVRSLRPYIDKAIEQMEAGKEGDCPLWIVNATNGEQAFEAMRKFAAMCPGGVAILDSIDAAQPAAVLAGEIGEAKVGNLAKLISDAMRKLIGVAEGNKVTLIFINQIRDKITMYGDPTSTPGGKALKFYASQRIQLFKPRKADYLQDADANKYGVIIRYKIIKNKLAPDGNENSFLILFKNGIFYEQELVSQCCNFGVLKMGGKGGKQVFLPKLDRTTNEYVMEDEERAGSWMSQFNAARRLLMDATLVTKLSDELKEVLKTAANNPIDTLSANEIQDAE